jgi:hypothetical protein
MRLSHRLVTVASCLSLAAARPSSPCAAPSTGRSPTRAVRGAPHHPDRDEPQPRPRREVGRERLTSSRTPRASTLSARSSRVCAAVSPHLPAAARLHRRPGAQGRGSHRGRGRWRSASHQTGLVAIGASVEKASSTDRYKGRNFTSFVQFAPTISTQPRTDNAGTGPSALTTDHRLRRAGREQRLLHQRGERERQLGGRTELHPVPRGGRGDQGRRREPAANGRDLCP